MLNLECVKNCYRFTHTSMMGLVLVAITSGCQNLDASMIPPRPQIYRNLGSDLSKLVSTYETGGIDAAMDSAKSQGIQTADGMVRVIIVAKPGCKSEALDAVNGAGGRFETSYEDLVQALVSIGQLKALASNAAVSLIRLPITSHPEGSSGLK